MIGRLSSVICALALVLGSFASAAPAEAISLRPSWAAPGQDRGERPVRPVRDVIDSVRQQVGGEFVSMRRLERNADPPFYVLLWRFPGEERHREIRVNALTGRLM